jgi:hypothetical protein
MISLTITKTGRIELGAYVKVGGISLNAITLYLNIYNLATITTYVKAGRTTTIAPGYYTFEQLRKRLPDLSYDENTLKASIDGVLTGGLKKLISDDGSINLSPLSLYLHVDGIDASSNLFNGQPSNLLSIIPVGKTNVGQIFEHQPIKSFKQMHRDKINSINVEILDEWGNKYNGEFVAELTLVE